MNYEVLSPIGEIDKTSQKGILPRVLELNGKTIGLFTYFKPIGQVITDELEIKLKARFPKSQFSRYTFPIHGVEIMTNKEYKETFKQWLKSVDTVITGHSD